MASIRGYINNHDHLSTLRKTGAQWCAWAFDLGDVQGHPPKPDAAISATDKSVSGPWAASIGDKTKVTGCGNVVSARDVQCRRANVPGVAPWPKAKGYLHSEGVMTAVLPGQIARYTGKHGHAPRSISVFTYYSPCSSRRGKQVDCISVLKHLPKSCKGVAHWYIGWALPWAKVQANFEQLSGVYWEPSKAPKDLPSERNFDQGWDLLEAGGWTVI